MKDKTEAQLVSDVMAFQDNPTGFVRLAFPWGDKDGELADSSGPREWQQNVMDDIANRIADGKQNRMEAIQEAVASGHGIGKSALVAWLTIWGMSTMEDAKVVVTANTATQLQTKTWPELAKWHRLAINSHWFTFAATSMFATDPAHSKTWRTDAIPWNENRPESFAGLHNKGRRILVIFDEASWIPDIIWETAEGAMTDEDTQIIWCAFGNPTRNTGRFRECFGRLKHRWTTRQIDSRKVPGTNTVLMAKWVEDYGEDHDFVRVRVRGVFPRTGSMQFISSEDVVRARDAEPISHLDDPVILGVDVARFGDDESVIFVRRGRDARTHGMFRYRGLDTMELVGKITEIVQRPFPDNADMIFVDETGIGAGVVDRLRQLGFQCMGINFGKRSDAGSTAGTGAAGENFYNKSSEMWGAMRAWLKEGAAIPDDHDLEDQLSGREYGYNTRNQIQLERKDDMKRRGLSSPDLADALALTFAYPVRGKSSSGMFNSDKLKCEWNPFDMARA